ncbi:MAG: polyribonucleotide nucleotidyltransferase [Opitutales bacterium]|nr:polyribonucleotide nucleotidyltransferase [Opitutales bacterium]
MKQKNSVSVEGLDITISTGTLALQASGSVVISSGETSVFVSATAASNIRPGQDFFPLTVDYREKYSAVGKFPGGYIKRESRPSEKEILTSRLCDRPLRPLFPKGFLNEVQVIGYLLSADLVNEPDILMVNGASAAMMISDIPWAGPVGCVRIGEIDDEFVVNPTNDQMIDSTLDLIYVGNEKEMMMIEGSAEQIPEDRFVQALEFAQEAIQPIIKAQKELAAQVAKPKKEFELFTADPEILALCRETVEADMSTAIFQDKKQDRENAVNVLKEKATEVVTAKYGEDGFDEYQIAMAFEVLQEEVYRSNILDNGKRADGRAPLDLREITCETGVLPRTHGTAVFQRGETQSLVVTTLGTGKDAQSLDGLTGGPQSKSFILHYNFPPFSVGECGRFGVPGRREIGHGALAERSLLPVIPGEDEFPYAIRVVSEIMGSNGSTSMASVCGGCLSLMDAGVPITDTVAGISAGLITEFDEDGKLKRHEVLSDILGAEDHFGDMDFKICGTRNGITGFQLDLKIQGLDFEVAKEAIKVATETRYKILDVMESTLQTPREDVNEYAPRVHVLQIDPEKIGLLIGPGGKNIRRIVETTGANIDIDEDDSGRVSIYATSKEAMDRAIYEVELVTGDIEEGKIYRGIVRSIKDFGAFVECLPGKEGLVHISELADFRVRKTEDVCKVGDEMIVKCLATDEKGRVRLSRKAALAELEQAQGGGDSEEAKEEAPAEPEAEAKEETKTEES